MKTDGFPWYHVVSKEDDSILQGDLIPNCPIIIPPSSLDFEKGQEIEVVNINCIVITHSCDLYNMKVEGITLCPYLTFQEFTRQQKGDFSKPTQREALFEELRKGRRNNYIVIDKYKSFGLESYIVIDFSKIFTINIELLQAHVREISDRLRLLPPYREHFSQEFAKFFMRVGLPIDLKYEE